MKLHMRDLGSVASFLLGSRVPCEAALPDETVRFPAKTTLVCVDLTRTATATRTRK